LDLRKLIEEELLAYDAKLGKQVARIDGPAIELAAKPAEVIGMVVHELTSNAVKYGALSAAAGRLAVNWSIGHKIGEPMLLFQWQESGVSIPTKPTRRGLVPNSWKAVSPINWVASRDWISARRD
jgi:two-component sensor histidine kinase